MHGDKPVQQKHASSQAGNPSYRWWLYVSIVVNSTLGILCTASIVFVAVHDDLTGLSGAAIVGTFLSCAFLLIFGLGVLPLAAAILLAMMICEWSALSWTNRIIAALALTVGGIPPLVICLYIAYMRYAY